MPASPVAPAVQPPLPGAREEPACRDRPVIVSLEVGRRQEARKIKRLVAMFRLWGSKSEMQMTPLEDHLHQQTQAQQQQQQQQQQQMAPPHMATTSLAFGPSELIGSADPGEVPVQRLWQSLVVPLVLGCVIFLLAIWTRQISLLVVNDAIVMLLILGSVFIVMSAVAFWLAQEQQQHQQQQQQSSGDDELATSVGLSADNHTYRHLHHLHHCPHQHHHHHHRHRQPTHQHPGQRSNQLQHVRHHLHLNQQQQSTENQELAKCCSIAFIDLQPPDYYSALRDSFPVVTPPIALEEANGESSGSAATNAINLAEPPSYAELASHQLEFQAR